MIRVSNISKTYQLWRTPFSRLLAPMLARLIRPWSPERSTRIMNRYCQPVHALSEICFTVESGDSLGIIGLNGSGKSTLLQIIAGTLQPTTGSVEVRGRIAALLELGSGFDPEFTGRENVFINGAILGLSRAEIESRYQSIVDFADIGDFIERPVKTYSSGMMLRLAFAVQVHVDPDVLIVDEALAVGDARFQAKAFAKVEEILKRGTTLLFVGHDLSAVRAFCNRALLLDKGRVTRAGIPDDVIADYLFNIQKNRVAGIDQTFEILRRDKDFVLTGYDIVTAQLTGHGQHAVLGYSHPLQIQVDVSMTRQIASPCLIFDIIDNRGMQLSGKRVPIPDSQGLHRLSLNIVCTFQKGIYRLRFRLVSAPSIEQTLLLSRYDELLSIEMVDDVRDRFTGLFPLPLEHHWSRPENMPAEEITAPSPAAA